MGQRNRRPNKAPTLIARERNHPRISTYAPCMAAHLKELDTSDHVWDPVYSTEKVSPARRRPGPAITADTSFCRKKVSRSGRGRRPGTSISKR